MARINRKSRKRAHSRRFFKPWLSETIQVGPSETKLQLANCPRVLDDILAAIGHGFFEVCRGLFSPKTLQPQSPTWKTSSV